MLMELVLTSLKISHESWDVVMSISSSCTSLILPNEHGLGRAEQKGQMLGELLTTDLALPVAKPT